MKCRVLDISYICTDEGARPIRGEAHQTNIRNIKTRNEPSEFFYFYIPVASYIIYYFKLYKSLSIHNLARFAVFSSLFNAFSKNSGCSIRNFLMVLSGSFVNLSNISN